MRYLIILTAIHCLLTSALPAVAQDPTRIDVGSSGDERCVGEGFYHREGPHAKSKWELVSKETFRWAKNRFSLSLPVTPGQHNEVTLRAIFRGPMIVCAGDTWKTVVTGTGKDGETVRFTLPAEVVGDRREMTVRFAAVYPRKPAARDKRTLFLILSEIEVRPVAELSLQAALDATPLPPPPTDHRDCLRNIERRPPVSDPVAYAELLAAERANVVTLGTMNGRGLVFFPTDLAATDPKMDADYLPRVISELRKRDIHVMSWVVFNIQDVRNADDFMPIKRFPEWKMVGIEEPGKKYPPCVGMCLLSSPYIEHHAKLLKQAAAFDIDGFFFDGFYHTEMPRPAPAGCVCEFCRARFEKETGLGLPERVDWADPAFRRWVRWRNERLLAVARYFQDEIRKVNPDATCTFNTNTWPFGNKDWETAVPLWRVEGMGVSQHGYSPAYHQKWLMLGFKARLGRDMNPEHSDMWRAAALRYTCGEKHPDWKWHELEMLTFLLAGPTYGITPWHSTIQGPVELTARIHTQAALREPFFSRRHVADVAVLVSQNTHDFRGHEPGSPPKTDRRDAYRDGILGTWMLLTENHVPFEFVFDNNIDAQTLARYKTLVLPDAEAISDEAVGTIGRWIASGGHCICTGAAGRCNEWGAPVEATRLEQNWNLGFPQDQITRVRTSLDAGHTDYFPADPGLAYCRSRDPDAKVLVAAVRERPLPFEIEAPASRVANLFVNPKNDREYWIHLLNVSHLMPDGDTGYRGMNRPPAERGVSKPAGPAAFGAPLVPAESVRIRLRDVRPTRARLGIAGTPLKIEADGTIVVPRIDLHDVVVVE